MAASDSDGPLDAHLRAISDGRSVLEDARRQRDRVGVNAAHDQLRSIVHAAREAGASWMQIGERLDIARGNAYGRYRRRPSPSGDSHHLERASTA